MASAANAGAIGMRVLSLLLGVFVTFMGIDKLDWLTDTGPLSGLFYEWLAAAPPASRWYLEHIAIPGLPLFARAVPLAELAVGAALVAGYRVRVAALVMLFMVLNFHFASDVLFHYSYLINAYGPPVMGGLLALAIGGTRLPWGLTK
jgi:uncharacterized membrane protein YphA (DoxX/SURF4 family)